jgi:hypothetical protein
MMPGTVLNFVPLLLGIFAAQPGLVGQSVTRLVDQDETVLRVPVQPRPLMPQFEWHEKKGPKCFPVAMVRRALLSGPQQVDFVLGSKQRIRAHLDEDCPALDFYSGLYLQLQDEKLCAGRDAIRSRMGGSCTIDRFKLLVPEVRKPERDRD